MHLSKKHVMRAPHMPMMLRKRPFPCAPLALCSMTSAHQDRGHHTRAMSTACLGFAAPGELHLIHHSLHLTHWLGQVKFGTQSTESTQAFSSTILHTLTQLLWCTQLQIQSQGRPSPPQSNQTTMTPQEVDNLIRPLILKDLRIQTRVRGLSPAGGIEVLRQRLKEHMLATGDFAIKNETGEDQATVHVIAGLTSHDQAAGKACNNYVRPTGQNVGNFLTDRPSSRVLAAPGGASQIVFGDAEPAGKVANNNYSRPAGQNVGNFLTDKPSSRVLAAPGGASQIHFG